MSTVSSPVAPLKSSLRVVLVIVLAFASLVPLLIVDGIADERRNYFNQARHEVASSWGLPQEITGPVLVVPVDYRIPVPVGGKHSDAEPARRRVQLVRKHVLLLPDELEIEAVVDYEMRERAIYQVALFSADVAISGSFLAPVSRIKEYVLSLGGKEGVIDWSGAKLVLGVSDPRAIRLSPNGSAGSATGQGQSVLWGETATTLEAGSLEAIIGTSVQVPLVLTPVAAVKTPVAAEKTPVAAVKTPVAAAEQPVVARETAELSTRFALRLSLGTTERLAVNALGGNTQYSLTSTWPHPSFNGTHSPVRRELAVDGFSAEWEVHGLARSLPDLWVHEDRPRSLSGQQMGVSFYNPVTTYTIIDRGIKYGLLFIALTFLTFLCFELGGHAKFHVVQYGVVSLGLIMFYMTLLATSEHLSFLVSYLLATALIVGLLGAYTWGMTASEHKQKLVTATLVGVLLGLYGTLFVLLQLEDYALLMGTTLLLIGLGALMYATRNLRETSSMPGASQQVTT